MTGQRRMTITAAIASMLAALPLSALTATQGWTIPTAVAITAIAGIGWLLRQRRVPAVVIVAAQLVFLTLWVGVLVAADTAWLAIIPTSEWAGRLVEVAGEGFDGAQEYAAPVPVERGILMLLVGGVGLVAIAVDLIAVSLRRVPLAGPLLAANYAVVAGIFGGGITWIWFALPAVGFLMLLAAEGRNRVAAWGRSATPSGRHSGIPETASLTRSGRRAGAVALGAAVLVPTALPVLSEGLLDGGWGGGSGNGSGRTIRVDNPVVDLQRSLNLSENVPMLRYNTESDRRAYIRVATNDVFDGDEWTLSSRDVDPSQRVQPDTPLPLPTDISATEPEVVDYAFEVTDDYPWKGLPVPYPPYQIEIDGDYRYDAITLDVIPADGDARGTSYRVRSLDVDPDPQVLYDAPRAGGELDDMRALPDGVEEELQPYLDEAVGELTNPHEQAVALQSWFRSTGGFSYDTLVPESGTSSNELINFLEVRVGFCQQFALTMTIMARALDIPARVAVGFTPGDIQDDGSRVVGAHDAHAWPELYFEGSGWVPWEPTPAGARTLPPTWTQELEEDAEDDSTATNAPETDGALPDDGLDEGLLDPNLDAGGGGGLIDTPSQWPIIAGVAAGAAALLSLPWLVARGRRELRWRRAGSDPVAQAEAAWADLRDAVSDSALQWDPAATPRRIGRDVATATRFDDDSADSRGLLDHVVDRVERARYAPRVEPVDGLKGDAAQLRHAVLRSQPWHRRARAWLWPYGVSELITLASNRVVDGLDWLDTANHRLRERVTSRLPTR
jgi:transglutaminase-like putative cysteine protease